MPMQIEFNIKQLAHHCGEDSSSQRPPATTGNAGSTRDPSSDRVISPTGTSSAKAQSSTFITADEQKRHQDQQQPTQ